MTIAIPETLTELQSRVELAPVWSSSFSRDYAVGLERRSPTRRDKQGMKTMRGDE
jgi:hypothetical protein